MRLLSAIVLLCAFYSIDAAVSYGLHAINPDYPGKCWHSASKVAYDVGTHQLKNGCGEISCSEAFTLQTKTCGLVLPPPGYRNEYDLTKPYPDCCTNFVSDKTKRDVEAAPIQ